MPTDFEMQDYPKAEGLRFRKRALSRMEVGCMYRIRYGHQSGNYQWYTWTFIAKYLGYNKSMDQFEFSLRPEAGTQVLDRKNVIQIDEMPRWMSPSLPKKVPGSKLEKPDA